MPGVPETKVIMETKEIRVPQVNLASALKKHVLLDHQASQDLQGNQEARGPKASAVMAYGVLGATKGFLVKVFQVS